MNHLIQIVLQNYPIQDDTKTFWGISYDGWFTGLVPILIFILGYLINKLIENRKEKIRLNKLEEYFKNLIELLREPVKRQRNEFIKTSRILKEKKEQHILLNEVSNFHVDQIKEINSKDLYSIFIKNKKGNITEKTELYGKIKAGIDYFDNVKKNTRKDFTLFWESYDKNQNEFKQNLEITDEAFNTMIVQSTSPSLKEDRLLAEVDQIRLNWFTCKKEGFHYTDMYVAKEMYLEPLRELCKQNMRDPRSVFLLKYIMLAIYALNNIDEAKKVFRRHFLFDARGLQKSWMEVNNALIKFNLM